MQNIVHNRGGLHNRITRKISLLPFTLFETEEFLKIRKINLSRYQLLQLYMAMGGVPHYLKAIKPGQSAAQNIDRICFAKDGILREEFANLYRSLFAHAENHITIIRALAGKKEGLDRNELLKKSGLLSGGAFTKIITELEESGFITRCVPFEGICLKHINQILKKRWESAGFIPQNHPGELLETKRSLAYNWICSSTGATSASICVKWNLPKRHSQLVQNEILIDSLFE